MLTIIRNFSEGSVVGFRPSTTRHVNFCFKLWARRKLRLIAHHNQLFLWLLLYKMCSWAPLLEDNCCCRRDQCGYGGYSCKNLQARPETIPQRRAGDSGGSRRFLGL